MSVISYANGKTIFDPELVRALSDAVEQICAALKLQPDAHDEREDVAARILELARGGEHDVARLRDRVMVERAAGRR